MLSSNTSLDFLGLPVKISSTISFENSVQSTARTIYCFVFGVSLSTLLYLYRSFTLSYFYLLVSIVAPPLFSIIVPLSVLPSRIFRLVWKQLTLQLSLPSLHLVDTLAQRYRCQFNSIFNF